MPEPRWGTPRTPGRETLGTAAGVLARTKLRRPFLPWQQHVADVALEIDPATGLLAYRTVIVLVPRQSGKTTGLLFPIMVLRCLAWGARQQVIYTAQDRNGAREKFEEDFLDDILVNSTLVEGRDYTSRKSNGSERLKFAGTGSLVKISATENSSGHGRTLDLAAVDEAWKHRDTHVDMGFAVPMVTRTEPQVWVLTTAGNEFSAYLKAKRAMGRAAVESGATRGVCHFEWAGGTKYTDPDSGEVRLRDDWDPADRRLWWFVMPALGHTIDEAAVEDHLTTFTRSDWVRSYYNIDQDTNADEGAPIGSAEWDALADTEAEMVGDVAFGVCLADGAQTAHVASAGWADRDGAKVLVEVVRAVPAAEVVKTVAAMAARHGALGVGLGPDAPEGAFMENLVLEGAPVLKLARQALARATGAFLTRARGGSLCHLGQPELDDSVAESRLADAGAASVWDRRRPGSAAATAATLALGALLGLGEPFFASVYDERPEALTDWDK